MNRFTLFLLTLLMVSTLSCVKEERVKVPPARPFVATNTGNTSPPSPVTPPKNTNSTLYKILPSPSPTPAISTVAENPSNGNFDIED
jgi:hypothetical protein